MGGFPRALKPACKCLFWAARGRALTTRRPSHIPHGLKHAVPSLSHLRGESREARGEILCPYLQSLAVARLLARKGILRPLVTSLSHFLEPGCEMWEPGCEMWEAGQDTASC